MANSSQSVMTRLLWLLLLGVTSVIASGCDSGSVVDKTLESNLEEQIRSVTGEDATVSADMDEGAFSVVSGDREVTLSVDKDDSAPTEATVPSDFPLLQGMTEVIYIKGVREETVYLTFSVGTSYAQAHKYQRLLIDQGYAAKKIFYADGLYFGTFLSPDGDSLFAVYAYEEQEDEVNEARLILVRTPLTGG